MKVKFEVYFDTETNMFGCDLTDDSPKEFTLEHSGSSYLRFRYKGWQIGTVGGHCPGPQEFIERWKENWLNLETCGHGHLNFSIDRADWQKFIDEEKGSRKADYS